MVFFFSSRRRHTRSLRDWSSDVCSSDLIHAQIVSQLLRTALDGAAPMRSLLGWQALTWMLAWSFAGGLLGLRARSPWWFGLTTAGGLVTVGVVAFIAFLRGWWIPVVPPAATLIGAAALVTAHQSYREAL